MGESEQGFTHLLDEPALRHAQFAGPRWGHPGTLAGWRNRHLVFFRAIGGIIILAAASYFMLKGFTQTSTGETTENIGTVGEKFRLELENMGLEQDQQGKAGNGCATGNYKITEKSI